MTTNNDYDNRLLSYKSSDQSVTFAKLSLKILEPNSTPSEVEDKIHDLNRTFNHLLPNGFDFNKVFPVHQLLSVLQKCQAALDQGNIDGVDEIDFSLAIKRLEPLWYNDLLCQLEKQEDFSSLFIKIFLSDFLHQTHDLKLDSTKDISWNDIPESYEFYDFILNKTKEMINLKFKNIHKDKKNI